MKEIAGWIDMAPCVLSSLYTTVLPNYSKGIKSHPPDPALAESFRRFYQDVYSPIPANERK
ncbi:hypothetical protein [Parabacteroides distasonis]|uniref:Uncharacterized protein n=1 Tax=Parabacteroides distasonis TaxID=823 RepID=A0A4S2EEM4_PARDI|nr:hypothetical protein [Parabacteroides distasonis]TGY54167.1 hypothetical protein E5342_17725 [Parabacteroides distasonis]